MQKNMGTADRILRVIIGIALLAWGGYSQNLWGAFGAIPLFTAMVSWCPLYVPFGINTTKKA